jgi:Helix-turn-helix domain
MGKDLMNQADAVRGLKVSEKAVLNHFARIARDETALAWQKQETIAERLNCCVETVRQATKRLVEQKHISRLHRQAKVFLYLVHPDDSLHLMPKPGWQLFEQHLRKGHFPFSFYPNVAGWLASRGLIEEAEANEVLAKFHAVKARKKRRSDSLETFARVQRHWAYTLKKLGLDPQTSGAKLPAAGEEYKENNEENIKSIETGDDPRFHEPPDAYEKKPIEYEQNPQVIQPSPIARTTSVTEEQQASVQHILAGVNRPDRYSFASDQLETSDAPE